MIVKAIAANSGYAEAIGGPGTPGMVSVVVAPRILPGVNPDINYNQSTLAHELLHACNVFHHGDAPYSYTWITRQPDGRMLSSATNNGGGGSIQVLTEQNTSASYMFPVGMPVKVIVGVPNDPHTGDEDCVMRYDDATGHASRMGPERALLYAPESTRVSAICTSGAGTGINGSDWQPQPRYGDAASGRGNCLGQILVNDGVAAPRR